MQERGSIIQIGPSLNAKMQILFGFLLLDYANLPIEIVLANIADGSEIHRT